MFEISGISIQQAQQNLFAAIPQEFKSIFNRAIPVSENQKQEYKNNGFIKIEKVIEGEVLHYARNVIASAVLKRKESDIRTLAEKSQYEQSFLQCGYLCWDFPAVKDFVFAKRFAGIARDLMQVDGVRLWHDQALFKEPGGRITDMHQDISYWPVKTENTITMWLALQDVPVEKGSMYFLPGTHKMDEMEYVDIFKNPHVPERFKNAEKIFVSLKAGDATFHSGLTFHGAGANTTDQIREAMTIIYIADGTRFDASDERNATHTSCQGLKDGDIIDTKFTPLLI